MSRDVPEWIGKSDNTAIPPRVKLIVFVMANGKCAQCTRFIGGRITAEYDHKVALVNGGANRQSNLQLLCSECHSIKSGTDVAEKSKVARIRKKHIGIRAPSRFPAARNSIWKKKINGTVERR